MLDHPTLDQLKTLRLDGMAEAFAEMQTQDGTANLTHAEWLGLLIDREATSRETKRFESRMRTARLRHVGAAPEDGSQDRCESSQQDDQTRSPRIRGGQVIMFVGKGAVRPLHDPCNTALSVTQPRSK